MGFLLGVLKVLENWLGWWLHNLASIVEVSRYRGKWPHSSLFELRSLEYKQCLVFLSRIVLCICKLHTHSCICKWLLCRHKHVSDICFTKWRLCTFFSSLFLFFFKTLNYVYGAFFHIIECISLIHFRVAWHHVEWLKHNLLKILMDVHLSCLHAFVFINTEQLHVYSLESFCKCF